MNPSIKLSGNELKQLYEFMEEANELFHQPLNYKDSKIVEAFATKNYPIIRKFYYEVLWDKLPQEEKDRILDE